ncbi:MAG: 4-hydroxy-3-methylbut-2-enyl diphosphate reductase [Candidatus Omnitrophica bacterium]|nr:4-hydroxy-3-methylbut-2-enyl diphosphate reductase [Candidatus Omnitrophota bacterium]
MKINIAKSAGFCFGVKRALNIALDTAKSHSRVYMLGDIVHNEDVVRDIEKRGIKKVKRLSKGKNRILLIRAHGASNSTINKAHRIGYKVIDATCPMVKEIHRIAHSMEAKGYKIIIIGDSKHDEVRGIIGQLKNKALVIDRPESIKLSAIRKLKKASVIVQSTQNIDNAARILKILKLYIKDLKFFNTICRPTQIKQGEIKNMPKKNDVMIIIGSKNSANTKRLYEISKSLNSRSYWISRKDEIKKSWFSGTKTVGVTAGASTPDSTTNDVVTALRTFYY